MADWSLITYVFETLFKAKIDFYKTKELAPDRSRASSRFLLLFIYCAGAPGRIVPPSTVRFTCISLNAIPADPITEALLRRDFSSVNTVLAPGVALM